jgi:serine protease AprX
MSTLSYFSKFKNITSFILVTLLFVSGVSVPATHTSGSDFTSYIIQGSTAEAAAQAVERVGGVVTSRLDIIQGVGAMLPAGSLPSLVAGSTGLRVTPNYQVKAADLPGAGLQFPETDYPDLVGADLVWEAGPVGAGVTVAVIDTGLANHKAVLKDVNGRKGRVVGWKDFVNQHPKLYDPNGHGTHVAGIIANTQLGLDGEWNGVAPGVNLVAVRVLNEIGMGTYEQVIQGIQWVVQNKDVYNIRVMNLSLVALAQSPYWADPLNQAVMQAWASGIVAVAAAGNGGPGPMTVGVPGNIPYVITVGAYTDNYTPADWGDDYLAPFSAAGPTLDWFVKPDVVAPGAHMVGPMLPGAYLARTYPDNKRDYQYFSMAGTSQASAVVSGIAALVIAQNPDLTPDEVKYRLMITALPWIDGDPAEPESLVALYSMWQQGAGRVNALDAVFETISGEANIGMDIAADLAGDLHYEGFSYYIYDDEAGTGEFRLRSDPGMDDYSSWSGGYGAWSGGYGAWSGATEPGLVATGPGQVATVPGRAVTGLGAAAMGLGAAAMGPGAAVTGPGAGAMAPGLAATGLGAAARFV